MRPCFWQIVDLAFECDAALMDKRGYASREAHGCLILENCRALAS